MTVKEMMGTIAVTDLQPANDLWIPDSQEGVAGSEKALTLEELASRQQAAMAKLKETTSAFDNLLEETTTAVDESISESDMMADEVNSQAAEKAAAVLAEAQAQAKRIISEGARESRMVAKRKVRDLIEAARYSAGRVARPDWEQQPLLTGEIWAALEASIGESFQSLLKHLQNLEEETNPKDQEQTQTISMEASLDTPEADGNGEREMPASAGIRSPIGQTTAPHPSNDPLFGHIGHSKPTNSLAFKQSLRL